MVVNGAATRPKLTISGVAPPFFLYSFMAWARTTLPFYVGDVMSVNGMVGSCL